MTASPHHTKKILLLAGEASGDNLGSLLIDSLRQQANDYEIAVMGQKKMLAKANQVVLDAKRLAIVGIWESLTHWRRIKQALNIVKHYIRTENPALVVLIDYPGFNLHVAQYAKQAGAKVLFYVSPQIWAWRAGRIHKIKQRVDHMAVLFEFEKYIYQRQHIPVTWVGHPMLNWVNVDQNKQQLRQQFGLQQHTPVLCLLPGSRSLEIKRHIPIIKRTIGLILAQQPECQFVLALASSLSTGPQAVHIQQFIERELPQVKIIAGQQHQVIAASDAAICASGTVTLEVALLQTPMLVFYKLGWVSYCLVRGLVKTPWVALCNIICQRQIVQEFIQHHARPRVIAKEALRLLKDTTYAEHMRQQLADVKKHMQHGATSTSDQVAQIAQSLV